MVESTFELGVKLTQMVLGIVILSILIHRKRKFKIRALNWFILVFSFGTLQGLMEIGIYIIKIQLLDRSQFPYFRFNEYHTIPYGITIIILYLFSEAQIGLRPHPLRFGIIIGLFSSYLTMMVYETFNNYNIVFDDKIATDHIFNVLFDFFQLFSMSFISVIFWKSYKLSNNDINRKASFMLFLSVFSFAVFILYELGENLLGLPPIFGAITFGISFLIIAYVYLKYPYFVFSMPNTIYRITIATDGGITIYSADISLDEKEASNELITTSVSAITSLMTEIIGISDEIGYASMGERALIVKKKEKIFGFMIVDKPTRIIHAALDQFVNEFHQKYEELLKKSAYIVSEFEDTKSIIARCFPFVETKDITQRGV